MRRIASSVLPEDTELYNRGERETRGTLIYARHDFTLQSLIEFYFDVTCAALKGRAIETYSAVSITINGRPLLPRDKSAAVDSIAR